MFDALYEHILNQPQTLIESEVDEVYESVMSVLIEDGMEKMQASLDHLGEISSRLKAMKEQEERERKEENNVEILAAW